MRNPARPGCLPYVLAIEVLWRSGARTRDVMGRYRTADKAVRDAKRVRAAWSLLLGGWHFPPTYLVIDTRDGSIVYPSHPTEGSAHDGAEESNTGRLF